MTWSSNPNNLFMLIGVFIISAFIYWFVEIHMDNKLKKIELLKKQMELVNQEPAAFIVEARVRADKKKGIQDLRYEIENLRLEIEKTMLEIELEELKMKLPIKVNKF